MPDPCEKCSGPFFIRAAVTQTLFTVKQHLHGPSRKNPLPSPCPWGRIVLEAGLPGAAFICKIDSFYGRKKFHKFPAS